METGTASTAPLADEPTAIGRPPRSRSGVSIIGSILLVIVGAAGFQVAWLGGLWGAAIVVFLFCAARMAWMRSGTGAVVMGLLLGLATYLPRTLWLSGGTQGQAIAAGLLLAVMVGVFVWAARMGARKLPLVPALVLVPILWTGLEFVVGEVTPVRLSWLASGLAVKPGELNAIGVYGVGFVLMALAAMACSWRGINRVLGLVVAVGAALGIEFWQPPVTALAVLASPETTSAPASAPEAGPMVVAISAEHTAARAMPALLAATLRAHPNVDILVLANHTMDIHDGISQWSKREKKYVVSASQETDAGGTYHDTLVVTGPKGSTDLLVMRESLSPGEEGVILPLVDTAWGKIAVVNFHQFSSRREMDGLMRSGAEGVVVLTPDVEAWGRGSREEQTRLVRARALEYGVPVVRAVSTGESQMVTGTGQVVATAAAGGIDEMAARLPLRPGRVPADAIGAPICAGLGGLWIIAALLLASGDNRKTVARAKAAKAGAAAVPAGAGDATPAPVHPETPRPADPAP